MTDPVSLTASIIAIVGLCRASAKVVARFAEGVHNAPEELIATSNEVVDLNVILSQVNKAYHTDPDASLPPFISRDRELEKALTGQLTQAQTLLADLDTHVKSCSKLSGPHIVHRTIGSRHRTESAGSPAPRSSSI